MSEVVERFLRYVRVDTESLDNAGRIPSTDIQFELARMLEAEMKELGLSDVRLDEHCYVYGFIPANAPGLKSLGFIAHMDTVSPGKGVKPRIIHYEGGDIMLENGLVTDVETYPVIASLAGKDIIVTDGTTILGADDKAGVAEILTMCHELLSHPEIRHGKICIGFTPDEEVGAGADLFDVAGFGADFAYTVDGGPAGQIEYENFNAASVKVCFDGVNIHPGSAKNKMKNAAFIAEEFDSLLPAFERPEHTEGYEGFYMLSSFRGEVGHAELSYIVRDHDAKSFAHRKQFMQDAVDFINKKHGEGTARISIKDTYYNMKEKILPHLHLIDTATKAMRSLGIEPVISPVRGGTDGARLSYMGLPCPNLGTGGYFCHGQRELIPVEGLEKCTAVLLEIVRQTYGN